LNFQDNPELIQWRLHLSSPPYKVFQLLATDEGRAQFWAESAVERDGHIYFIFPNGYQWQGEILGKDPPNRFRLRYIGGTVTTFTLQGDGKDGTELTLVDEGVEEAYRNEVIAGWVSVLLTLKAAVDFSVDLRNHNPSRTWDQGFVEN